TGANGCRTGHEPADRSDHDSSHAAWRRIWTTARCRFYQADLAGRNGGTTTCEVNLVARRGHDARLLSTRRVAQDFGSDECRGHADLARASRRIAFAHG